MESRMAKISYGNGKASHLCQMSHAARLDLIAEGLPIILASSQSFWEASTLLGDKGREAIVMEGFAEEEAAKALILIDLVRCPRKKADSRVGATVRAFYDHLARLIYAKAQSWKPMNVAQLREYVDGERQAHDLEGYAGEYIVPNWSIYARESALYADIEMHEDGVPRWSDPHHYGCLIRSFRPIVLEIAEALGALGLFDRRGLDIIAEVWGTVDFHDEEHRDDSRRLTQLMLQRALDAGIVPSSAEQRHADLLFRHWQMPMYDLDFKMIDVPLETLEAQREANFWAEAGYHPAYG